MGCTATGPNKGAADGGQCTAMSPEAVLLVMLLWRDIMSMLGWCIPWNGEIWLMNIIRAIGNMEYGVWLCRCGHESCLSFHCPTAFSYRNLLLGTSTGWHSMSVTSVLCLLQDGSRGSCSRKKNYQWCLHGHFKGLVPGILLWRQIFQRTYNIDLIWIPLGSMLWCLAASSCLFFNASVACWDALLSHIHTVLVNW